MDNATSFLRTFTACYSLDPYAAAIECRNALAFDAVVVEGPEAGDWSVMDREQALDCGFIEEEV